MRSGCTLPATVLLLLFLGFSAWGARHWKPSIICDNSNLGWICSDNADIVSGLGGLFGRKSGSGDSHKAASPGPGHDDGGAKTVAHGFPWPIADKPRKWTNFRAATVAAAPVSNSFPWPVVDKPRKWTNFRTIPKLKKVVVKLSAEPKYKTVAHGFPWPIADKPRKWTNFRAAPKLQTRTVSDCGAELNRVARGGVILFETASATLDSSSYNTLDRLAGIAKSCDSVNIIVEGHTDDRGSAGFNQRLSERRAKSVALYLQGAGLASSNLSAVGYGESRPDISNDTAANRAKNRRIEFSVSGR